MVTRKGELARQWQELERSMENGSWGGRSGSQALGHLVSYPTQPWKATVESSTVAGMSDGS